MDTTSTIDGGIEFHVGIIAWWYDLEVYICWNLREWLSLVCWVVGWKWGCAGITASLLQILYIKVSLSFSPQCFRSSQFSLCSIAVMLAVHSYWWRTYRAAWHCTISRLLVRSAVWWYHTVALYSNYGHMRDWYANALTLIEVVWILHLKNPRVLFAFALTVFTCRFQEVVVGDLYSLRKSHGRRLPVDGRKGCNWFPVVCISARPWGWHMCPDDIPTPTVSS